MDTQCTDRRFQSYEELEKNVKAWEKMRNREKAKIDQSLTRERADAKLSKYYTP